jgi:hypothetical protein
LRTQDQFNLLYVAFLFVAGKISLAKDQNIKSDNDLSESAGSVMIINNSANFNYDNNSVDESGEIDIVIRSDLIKNTEIQI